MNEDQIRKFIKDEMAKQSIRNTYSFSSVPKHVHNGVDSPRISQADIAPSLRAMGSITFAQSTRYRLGITFNPTSVWFYGIAIRRNTVFTVTAANATAGATYTNNGQTFTVLITIAGGTTLTTTGTGSPQASGTLTKATGTGDATITFASSTTPIAIRASCIGNAQLGPSFYFQPNDSTSVQIGGLPQNIIQSSTYFGIDSTTSTPVVRAIADEGHLIDVEFPSVGTIVARATIISFNQQEVIIETSLADQWSIIGNYVVT